jgi:peptidoglycan/LPS O-acetylase OafA/YrhL
MNHRFKVLDFLRGVAIILVMLRHANLTSITTGMGWIGVDLFFVLSGFLVSGLLFSEYKKSGTIKPIRFLIRRGFKIYPLFYTVLILHIIYNYLKHRPVHSNEILSEIFFYQNYSPGILGISWSLAIEEHFYLLLSIGLLILYKINKLKIKYIIPVCWLIVTLICLFLRIYTWQSNNSFNVYIHFFPTHLRIDSLAFGVLIAGLYHFSNQWLHTIVKRLRWIIIISIPILLCPAFLFAPGTAQIVTFGFTCLYIGFGLLLALLIVYEDKTIITLSSIRILPVFNVIAWVGLYSYPIYLIHMKAGPILSNYFIRNYIPVTIEIVTGLNFAFNIFCGYILSLLIERPFLRLREKYYPAT